MASHERRALSPVEIASELESLPGWSVANGQIRREYRFERYKDGLVFATAAGFLADQMDHHPDLAIGYGRVHVALNTHDVNGISALDFELARRIERLLLD